MLEIKIPGTEFYDEKSCEFFTPKEQVLQLEHSLISISKWEGKWHKAFLKKEPRTAEETLDYFKCMTITQHVDPIVYLSITPEIADKINAYIDDPMTATKFNDKQNGPPSRDVITSELIYQRMTSLSIPFDCEKWHLNRLLTLIKVCDIKNAPEKKMGKKEAYARHKALNAARR